MTYIHTHRNENIYSIQTDVEKSTIENVVVHERHAGGRMGALDSYIKIVIRFLSIVMKIYIYIYIYILIYRYIIKGTHPQYDI